VLPGVRQVIVRISFAAVLWALAACSGPAKSDDTTPSQPPDAAATAATPTVDGGPGPASTTDAPTGPKVTTPPTEDECLALLDHMLRIQFAMHNDDKPNDRQLPEEDFNKIKNDMKAEFVPHCTSVFTRDAYDCSMAATTREQWSGCEGP
jgi:hypothetical protein